MNQAKVRAYMATATPEKRIAMLGLLDELEGAKQRDAAQANFMPFVRATWEDFIEGPHHRIMAKAFDRVLNGELKRLIINMPPRHTKSEFASHRLPAWFLGKNPKGKIIQTSNVADLAKDFGRKVRDLVDSKEYQAVFPGVSLKPDSKSAGRWSTNHGGEYFAVGINGRVTGRGADLFIIDDPHDEQEAASGDPRIYDKTFEHYTSGPRQRLQPGAAVIVVMTRWHKRDLTGRLVKKSIEDPDSSQWEVIELPAILNENEEDEDGNSLERPIWPGFWPLEELQEVRADTPIYKWKAQFQQDPVSEEGAILKREYWQTWEDAENPPKCDFTIQSWDTAHDKKSAADYSACTDWGVFFDDDGLAQIILLNAMRGRWEFVDLKEKAFKHYSERKPDVFIVEQKASGIPLTSELRRRGIVVTEFTPSRGNDKFVRANAAAPIFAEKRVWAPETRWAEEVITECAEFPAGDNDDYVDTVTQALIRFRDGGFIDLESDFLEDEEPSMQRRRWY